MAIYPGANYRPLDTAFTPDTPMAVYNRTNLHTQAGYGSLFGFFNASGRASSHFWVSKAGGVEQYQDTLHRAEADGDGNDATISIETEGIDEPWTPAQVDAIVALLQWIFANHPIPMKLVENSFLGSESSRGLGWHRIGIDGNFPELPDQRAGRIQRGGGMHYSSSYGKSCVPTDNTDVLTSEGWRPIGKVTEDDLVASVAPDGSVSFDKSTPIAPFMSETVHVGAFECTPDHEWAVRRPGPSTCADCDFTGTRKSVGVHAGHRKHTAVRSDTWVKIPAEDVQRSDVLLTAAPRTGGLSLTDAEIVLAMWAFADGHYSPYYLEFHVTKERKRDAIEAALRAMGWTGEVRNRSDGTYSLRAGEGLYHRIQEILPGKRLDQSWTNASARQADLIWSVLVQADGASTVADHKSVCFSTDKESLEVIQAMTALNGGSATMWFSGTPGLWWLLRRKHDHRLNEAVPARFTEVACTTTKNGTLIIRQGGRTVVTGNCPTDTRLSQIINEVAPRVFGGPVTPPVPTPQPPYGGIAEDGFWGRATTTELQRVFGTPIDGEIWGQYKPNAQPAFTSGWVYNYPNPKGSPLIRAMQNLAALEPDGVVGPIFIRELQRRMGTPIDGELWAPSPAVAELQRRINRGDAPVSAV